MPEILIKTNKTEKNNREIEYISQIILWSALTVSVFLVIKLRYEFIV